MIIVGPVFLNFVVFCKKNKTKQFFPIVRDKRRTVKLFQVARVVSVVAQWSKK